MMGTFGGYTRWAVVFLIIFVLFILLVPSGMGTGVVSTVTG
ncbi:YfmQ family protein [Sulfoacidibacillus thermotolerans]|nr:YfmQ family protein [Sulfoacidibacillus thermotolerans]